MDFGLTLILVAAAAGLFMAWGIGANDVANAMATSVGSRALTLRQAVLVAAVFEFAGAYLAGGEVTSTVRSGIVDAGWFTDTPGLLVYGMLAALLAAGVWLAVASHFGLPVSTTHSIIGAIVGFAAVGIGTHAVHWGQVGSIVASWVISPLLAGLLAFTLFRSVQGLILNTRDPFQRARRYVPVYIFATGFIMSLMTLLKGLTHLGLELPTAQSYALATAVGFVLALGGAMIIRRIRPDPSRDRAYHFANVERIFAVLMVVTACAMAFAHGSNDVANAVGPVAAVLSVVATGGVTEKAPVMPWVLLLGACGLVAGLMTYGHKVIATVGRRITDLTPSRGFCCELAAASTVVLASGTGLPVSTTHTLVGAVLGVGMARGIAALNLGVIGGIFMSWLITLPAGAILSVTFFYLLQALL